MSNELVSKNLGHATAYGYAKEKGYTGTESQFAQAMADNATNAATCSTKATEAAASATSAASSAAAAASSAGTAQTFVGKPKMAAAAADMTDETAIYVYVGTTGGGLTNGKWYYYDGEDWAEGGTYNATAFETDKTLSIADAAADAAAVGDLKSAIVNHTAMYRHTQEAILYDNLIVNGWKEDNVYYEYYNGVKAANNTYYAIVHIPVNPSHLYNFVVSQVGRIVYYDSNGDYISGKLGNSSRSVVEQPPSGAAFATLSEYKTMTVALYDLTLTSVATGDISNDVNRLSYKTDITAISLRNIIVTGKNLFNKNDKSKLTNTLLTGYTCSTLNGWVFNQDFYPIKPSTAYVASHGNLYISLYDKNFAVIGSYNLNHPDYDKHITTPSNAAYLRCSWNDGPDYTTIVNSLQFEEGSTSTGYESFGYCLKYPQTNETHDILRVGTHGQYSAVQDAVNAAADGDIIIIESGTYHEHVSITNKRLHLIGENMDSTIIEYSGNEYTTPPLEIAIGTVENLTMKAISDSTPTQTYKAYATHIDFDAQENNSLEFLNCKFISETHQVVGIGLRPNYTLRFKGCYFISTASKDALYVHDAAGTFADYSGQVLILDDCRFYTENDFDCIRIDSRETQIGCATLLAVNNALVFSGVDGDAVRMYVQGTSLGGGGYLNSSDWILDPLSVMNNKSVLNAS